MSGKTFSVSFQLNAALSNNFSKSFKEAGGSLGELGKKVNKYNLQAAKIDKVVGLRKATQELSKTYEAQKATLDRLNEAVKKSKSPTASLKIEQAEAAKAFRRTIKEVEKQRSALSKLEKEMKLGGTSTDFLINRQQRLASAIEKNQQILAAKERKESRWGLVKAGLVGAVGFAQPLLASGAKRTVTTGANAQKALSRVYAADPKMTEEQKKTAADEIRRLSLETGRDFSMVAEGFRSFLTAGFSLEDTIKSMPDTLSMAAAADIKDFELAAKIQSGILKSYGLGTDKAGMVADLATNAALAGFMDLPFFGDVAKIAGKNASDARMSLGELGAMAVALSDTNASGTEAGTSIRNIISRLTAPNTKAAEMFKAMKFNPLDEKGQIRPIVTLLAELQDKMDKYGLNEGERAKLLKTVFEEATMGHAKLLMEQARSGKLQESAVGLNERGISDRVAKIQEDNLMGDATKLVAAFEDLKMQLFKPIEGPLRTLAQNTTELVKFTSDFFKDHPDAALGATGAAGGAIAIGSAFVGGKVLKWVLDFLGLSRNVGPTGGVFGKLFAKIPKAGILSLLSLAPWYLELMASKANPEEAKKKFAGSKASPEEMTFNSPGLASGGIVTRPTLALVGEGRESEAVLPLSKLDSLLGNCSTGGNMTVHFSPTINISGSGDAYSEIKRGLAEGQVNFKRELERLLADQRRLSFS